VLLVASKSQGSTTRALTAWGVTDAEGNHQSWYCQRGSDFAEFPDAKKAWLGSHAFLKVAFGRKA